MYRSKTLNRRLMRERALATHFHLGLTAYDDGDARSVARHRSAIGLLPEAGPESLEFMALDWRAKWLEDRQDDALTVAEEITRRFPDDPDGVLELGHILVDLDRPEQALEVLLQGAQRHPDDPDIWYELGLVAERMDNGDLRRRAFREVWELEHDEDPGQRLFLTEQRFVEVVEETLARLPPIARNALGNVAIFIEDYPDAWIVEDDIADPRILGLFDGPDRAMENSLEAVIEGPARISIFRWNIERSCGSAEEAEEQVAITVLHEVGHYLGLDEEALHFMGLG